VDLDGSPFALVPSDAERIEPPSCHRGGERVIAAGSRTDWEVEMSRTFVGGIVVIIAILFSIGVAPADSADASQSSTVISKLTTLLAKRSLEAVAAADPSRPGRFVAALHLPGSQLLVIAATHPQPALLQQTIDAGNHRQAYIELHTTGATQDRFFVEDLQANGLQPTREGDEPFDIVWEEGRTQTVYDGNWERQRLTRDTYYRRFAEADRRYAALIEQLIASLEPSTQQGAPCCSD
jgi:hypothetical protein